MSLGERVFRLEGCGGGDGPRPERGAERRIAHRRWLSGDVQRLWSRSFWPVERPGATGGGEAETFAYEAGHCGVRE